MSIHGLARAIAVLFGASVTLAVVTAGSVQGTTTELGASVRVVAVPTGELGIEPTGQVLDIASLEAGRQSTGRVTVRNQTAVPLSVDAALTRPDGQSVDAVVITVTPSTFELEPGASLSLEVQASVAADAPATFQGRSVDATLRFTR